ncbi:MAG TPA: glycosyltransferase family 39 protein [Pirellulales bacterium]|nr:glycosyltransferase family 39 protein [Pirellulales bacterium]
MPRTTATLRSRSAIAALLAVHTALVAYSGWVHAPVMDELGHLAAGVSHWEFGRFGVYTVNPPLVRMVAALPVLAAGANTDWSSYFEGAGARPEFNLGDDFVRANGSRSFWLFTLARWGAIPLSLVGGCVCYLWAKELYGGTAGLAALTLWCFSPNVLAYAAIITPDLGATALGVAANYLFWRWLREPSWERAGAAGVVLGLAELTKTTWLVLFVIWPAVTWVWWWSEWGAGMRAMVDRLHMPPWQRAQAVTLTRGASKVRSTLGLACAAGWCRRPEFWRIRLRALTAISPEFWRIRLQLAMILVLAVYVINMGYGFEGTGRRLRDFAFVSRLFTGAKVGEARAAGVGNRFAKSWLGAPPVPLPAHYVLGIDVQRRDFERGMPSYLRGEWRQGGWWYYYLYALAIKVPLGTWALVLLAIGARIWRRGERGGWRNELVLLAPLAAVLVLVSSQTGISRYLRYVLPIAPYAFIWASGVFRDLRWRSFVGGEPPTNNAGPREDETDETNRTTDSSDNADSADVERAAKRAAGGKTSYLNESGAEESYPNCPPRESGGRCPPYDDGTARRPFPTESHLIQALALAALAWSVMSSLWYYPHSMSYFNELAGGPRGGHAHLIDANIDWGQDLLYLKRWLDDHPEARPLRLAYFGLVDPGLAGIEFTLPPKGPPVGEGLAARSRRPANLPPGWYAVSVNFMHGYAHRVPNGHGGNDFAEQGCFAYFLEMEPVATAGYSIYIFHVDP